MVQVSSLSLLKVSVSDGRTDSVEHYLWMAGVAKSLAWEPTVSGKSSVTEMSFSDPHVP
jgi:hypothetical protein